MKIAIVVQGRFHAFDLGIALLKQGHDVTLFTNYPAWAVRRFSFPTERVRSFWVQGVLSKTAYAFEGLTHNGAERWLNPMFGRWVARELARERWDVIHGWSGVSEEIYAYPENRRGLNLIMRGSAHIRTQDAILRDEERRTGIALVPPDEWIQQREEREYALADRIVVLSSFARKSFLDRGIHAKRILFVPLGANAELFRSEAATVEARCQRIVSGQPLRILYVGALSLRKGLWDARAIVQSLAGRGLRFTFVGPVTSDGRTLAGELQRIAQVIPKVPQSELPKWYAKNDVFMFPTLEDGYAVVLAQAKASGLPILTTANCCGPDLIEDGATGWVLPIRNPEAFVERLAWCDANRKQLAEMVLRSHDSPNVRTWDDVAAEFSETCDGILHPRSLIANA